MRVNTVLFGQGLRCFFSLSISLNDDRKARVIKILDGLRVVEREFYK